MGGTLWSGYVIGGTLPVKHQVGLKLHLSQLYFSCLTMAEEGFGVNHLFDLRVK